MPQARGGRLQIGITAEMKPEQEDGLGARGFLDQPIMEILNRGLDPRHKFYRFDRFTHNWKVSWTPKMRQVDKVEPCP